MQETTQMHQKTLIWLYTSIFRAVHVQPMTCRRRKKLSSSFSAVPSATTLKRTQRRSGDDKVIGSRESMMANGHHLSERRMDMGI